MAYSVLVIICENKVKDLPTFKHWEYFGKTEHVIFYKIKPQIGSLKISQLCENCQYSLIEFDMENAIIDYYLTTQNALYLFDSNK